MLSTLERHLLLRLVRVFVPVLLGMCGLFGLAGSLRLLQTDDLSLSQLLLVLPWILPVLLPYVVPLAYGCTVALVLGRMESSPRGWGPTSSRTATSAARRPRRRCSSTSATWTRAST